MTAAASALPSQIERLRAFAPVYVVDDAFDPPNVADNVEQFYLEVKKRKDVNDELQAIRPVAEGAEIDEQIIQTIWTLRDQSPGLKELADRHLFATRLQQLQDLQEILGHLRDLGLEPKPCGVAGEIPSSARLVFLDYVLDERNTLDLAKVAVQRAEALYDAAPKDAKPFIVLMSDHPDASKQHRDFRDQSKLMGGLFAFVKKAEARVREQLLFRMGTWGVANANFEHLQEFVVSVLQALDGAQERFRKRIYALDVHDYSFIQKECLYKDGQPLGEYLMWLFESSLGFSLRGDQGVMRCQSKLDSMRFDRLLPCDRSPSDNLAEFYLSAVTEPAVEDLSRHPLADVEDVPLLYLGDIFLHNDQNLVLLVLSAACDLAYRPTEKEAHKRSDPDQPVYLCPGTLKQLGSGHARGGDLWTELISLNEKPYRVEWDYRHVGAQKLRDIKAYLEKEGYRRRWRLRLPYALEVQQSFVAHVSRVGLPVPPAFVQQADVAIYGPLGADGVGQMLGAKIVGGIAVAEHKGQGMCVLTPECVSGMISRLDRVADVLLEQANALPEDTRKRAERVTAAQRRADGIRALKTRTDLWVTLVEQPFALPKVGEKSALELHNKSLVWAFRGIDLTKIKLGTQTTFAISIHILGEESTEPSGSDLPNTGVASSTASEEPDDSGVVALAVSVSLAQTEVTADVDEVSRATLPTLKAPKGSLESEGNGSEQRLERAERLEGGERGDSETTASSDTADASEPPEQSTKQ